MAETLANLESKIYGACQIVDLYHAREHYWAVAKACLKNKEEQKQWAEERRLELNKGDLERVIKAIEAVSTLPGYDRELCEREIGYFGKNRERMRYADFKKPSGGLIMTTINLSHIQTKR